MANGTRENELKVFLSDDEMYILNAKYKASGVRSKSSFIRMLILYGFVRRALYQWGSAVFDQTGDYEA